jgi:hypothetical protein
MRNCCRELHHNGPGICCVSGLKWVILGLARVSSNVPLSNRHSFCSLCSDRYIAPTKAKFSTQRSIASWFKFQCPVFSLWSSNSCFRRPTRLPAFYIFFSVTCFRRQLLRKMLAFLHFIVSGIFLFTLAVCSTLFFTPSS